MNATQITEASPASALLEAVYAHHQANDTLNFLTDSRSYPKKVLLAVWRPAGAFVMTIDKSEYDGLALAAIFGFHPATRDTAMSRAIEQRNALPSKK